MTQDKTQIELEQKIIHLLLTYKNAVEESIESGINADFFIDAHKHLVKAIFRDFVESNQKRRLNKENYKRITLQNDKSNLVLRLNIYDDCLIGQNVDFDDFGFLKKELIENYVGQKVSKNLSNFYQNVKNKGYQFATSNLIDELSDCVNLNETSDILFSSIKDLKNQYIEQLKNARENPATVIRCGWPEVDTPMNVGFKEGHLTLFVGDTGSHKTNIMLNLSLIFANKGFPVLFIPLEMPWKDVLNRIVSNKTGVDGFYLARPNEISDEDFKKISDAMMWMDNHSNLTILDSGTRLKTSSLRREIEKRLTFFQPKIIVIDYLDILDIEHKYGSRTIEIAETIREIRHMGRKYGFHIITAAQMNREAIKAIRDGNENALDSTAIQGSHSYSTDADTIFGLTPVQGEVTRIKITAIKARHGEKGQVNELTVDRGRSRISSCSIGSVITSEIDLENDINRNPAEISKVVSSLPDLDFASSDLDFE